MNNLSLNVSPVIQSISLFQQSTPQFSPVIKPHEWNMIICAIVSLLVK